MAKTKRKTNPYKAFLEANDFVIATSNLSRGVHVDKDTRLLAPLVVNMALIFELLLKCLLSLSGLEYPTNNDGHNLEKLFNLLGERDREAVMKVHRDNSKHYGINAQDADAYFSEALSMASKDFTAVRYLYEEGDKNQRHESRSLGSLILAAYAYIFSLKPEWAKHREYFEMTMD